MQLYIPSSSCHVLKAAGAAGAMHKMGAGKVQAPRSKHPHSSSKPTRERNLQQEVEVDLTSVPLGARGFSSRSLGSERILSPQAVQACALGSEYITQPSRKVPPVEMLLHLSMLPADR
jgi:hypothetical protein